MNKYLVFAMVICVLELIDAKSAVNDDNDTKNRADYLKDFKEIAQQINDKFHTTLLHNLLKLADQAKEVCPDVEEKMESIIDEIGTCVEAIDVSSDTFCSLIKKNYAKCSKPARDLIVSCLPTESKELPLIAEKVFLGIVDTACSSTVEEILELFKPCGFENSPSIYNSCTESKKTIDSYNRIIPSTSLICAIIPKLKNCAQDLSSCKNTITKTAHTKFYERIDNEVKTECDALNKA